MHTCTSESDVALCLSWRGYWVVKLSLLWYLMLFLVLLLPLLHGFLYLSLALSTTLAETATAQDKDSYIADLKKNIASKTSRDPTRIGFVIKQGLVYCHVPVKGGGIRFQVVVPTPLTRELFGHWEDNPS